MKDDEKKAAYPPVIKECLAKKNPSLNLATVLMLAADVFYDVGNRVEAVGIEKVTTVTPPPRPAAAIEKPKPMSVSPVANIRIIFPNLDLWRSTSAGASTAVTTAGTRTVIGQEFEKHVPVTVGHREREGGFYILGQPRTGKSTLLVNMALSDIENNLGILFIDPIRMRSMIF